MALQSMASQFLLECVGDSKAPPAGTTHPIIGTSHRIGKFFLFSFSFLFVGVGSGVEVDRG